MLEKFKYNDKSVFRIYIEIGTLNVFNIVTFTKKEICLMRLGTVESFLF